jgi:hypothetical protein
MTGVAKDRTLLCRLYAVYESSAIVITPLLNGDAAHIGPDNASRKRGRTKCCFHASKALIRRDFWRRIRCHV